MDDVCMPKRHEVEQGRGAPKPWPRDLDEKPGVGEGAPLLRNFSRRRFGNRHFIASHSLHGDLRVVAGLSTNGPVCTATQSVLQSSLHCKPKSATGKLLCAPNQVRPSRQRARGSLSPFRFRLSIANALSRTPRCGRLSPRNRQALLGISSPGFYSQRISGRRPPMKLCRSQISLLAIFLTGWLASCQQPYHQPEERYVFVAFNTSLPYWQEAEAGLNDAAKQMGVKAELTGPSAFSPNEELTAFQQAIAQKPSGILLSASNPEIFKAPISAAIQQGIPVICVDADSPESKRRPFVA